MEFQTGNPVADVDQAGAGVFLNDLAARLEIRQNDDARIFVNLGISLLLEIIVVLAVRLGGVEGFASLLQHFIHLLGDFQFHFFHDFDGFLDAHGIPGFKGSQLMVVAPLHGVVDGHDIVADFTDAVGRIDEVFAQILAGIFTGLVFRVEDRLH